MKPRFTSLLAALLVAGHASAQDPASSPGSAEQNLEVASLPFRTALHHDPTLDAPLQQLVKLYQAQGKVPEVIALYRNHLATYPGDRNSLIVYLRMLFLTGAPEALSSTRQAVQAHADQAYLHYLLFENLRRTAQPGAVDALDKAISLESDPIRRKDWISQFAPLAVQAGRLERATALLTESAAAEQSAEKKLEIARTMLTNQLFSGALDVLKQAAGANPGAEASVEISLATASAHVGLNDAKSASETLDSLLTRLTPDYWRRPEVFRRRIALIDKEAERTAMIDAARERLKQNPNSEAAIIDLSLLLDHFEFRREALDVLVEAGKKLPRSGAIEKATFDLLDLLRDEQVREKLLAEKLQADPSRLDLRAKRTETLFMLNRREEAIREMRSVSEKLVKEERVRYLTELARKLRRSSLPSASASIYEEVLPLAPERLDLRRELAETLIAAGKRDKALSLFAEPLPESTETENLIDLVQFLLQQKLNAPAHSALEKVLVKVPNDFDLNLLMLQIDGRLADRARGTDRVEKIRTLADSAARYRKWLEAAIAFHSMFDNEENFLTLENERLRQNQYDGQFDRRLAIIDAFSEHVGKLEGIQMLQELVDDPATQPADRLAARRDLVKALEARPDSAGQFSEQLRKLAEEDKERAEDHRARLALLSAKGGNSNEFGNFTQNFDPAKITDPGILTQIRDIFTRSYGVPPVMEKILRRLLELNPADRTAWEQWLFLIASRGDEEQFRMNARKLLAGIDQMPLSPDTRAELTRQLIASYWRSIAKMIAGGKEAELADALPLCTEVETVVQSRTDILWAAWARAFLLNRLGRPAERDAAIRELTRLVNEPNEKGEKTEQIDFPDGIAISLPQAQQILKAPLSSKPKPVGDRIGPAAPYAVRWAFDVPGGATVAACLPCGENRVVLIDSNNGFYGLERVSGKLAWKKQGPATLRQSSPDNSNLPPSVSMPLSNGKELLFVPNGPSLECWSAEDGHMLWRADGIGKGTAHPVVQTGREAVFVYSAESNLLSAIAQKSGKLLWQRQFEAEANPQRSGRGSMIITGNYGMLTGGDRIFVYGSSSYVINADTGETLWTFGGKRVSSFPIRLVEKDPTPNQAAVIQMNPHSGQVYYFPNPGTFRGNSPYSQMYRGEYPLSFAANMKYSFAAPAISWQHDQNNSRRAGFDGSNLLLSSGSGTMHVSLDAPFVATMCPQSGMLLGFDGRRALFPYGAGYQIFDSADGSVRQTVFSNAPRQNLFDEYGRMLGATPVAFDGPVAYVSLPAGIAMFRLSNGEVLDEHPWPASVAPPREEKPEGQQDAEMNGGVDLMAVAQLGRYHLSQQQQRPKPISPTPVVVDAGILYASPLPFRLVALVSADRKEPSPEPKP